MPRKRRTQAQKEAAAWGAWSDKQFKKGKPGSAGNWQRAAQALAGKPTQDTAHLIVLGLETMPETRKELVKARNKAMQTHHPDRGGSDELAKRINEAFEELCKAIKD